MCSVFMEFVCAVQKASLKKIRLEIFKGKIFYELFPS